VTSIRTSITHEVTRPLAAGTVSTKEALILFCALSLSRLLLILPLRSWYAGVGFVVAAFFLAVNVSLYQALLRRCRRLISASPSASEFPMAYARQSGGRVPADAWVLLLANVFWAIAYDTEYAMVDRER
jgi:4-hydroxybenzoate polyprenyltransferase